MFASVESALFDIVATINTYLSNYILVFLLVGVGLWYSVKTRFVQIRCFGEGMRKVFGNLSLRGGKQDHGMSSFQALATAIAAQVGTGNIVGGSGAILAGGPGAIFWMWVIAFFGMATIYAEGTQAGAMFVAVCLFFFAFSTILSWNLFGKINVVYLFGKKGAAVYSLLALVFIFLGTVASNDLVWEMTDMFNNLMVIPNAIALLALTGTVVKSTHFKKERLPRG